MIVPYLIHPRNVANLSGRDTEKLPGASADQGQRRGLARDLAGPQGQAELAHAGAQERNDLTDPDDGKGHHAGGSLLVGFHVLHLLSHGLPL